LLLIAMLFLDVVVNINVKTKQNKHEVI